MKNSIINFEDLSNELIYELFDYLSFGHISFAFGNLNKRYRNLIDIYSHYLNLQQHTQADVKIFPRSIRSLKISACYQFTFIDCSNLHFLHNLILSNLPTPLLYYIFNTIILKDLEYIYLGTCPGEQEFEQIQLAKVQEKILRLGQLKLKKCVFRTQLYANIDLLPTNLIFLEYLRIDGCENILIVNHLLDCLPNLIFFHVSVLKTLQTVDNKDQYMKQNNRKNCLTNLTLRIHDVESTNELIPLFIRHCSNLKHLIIYVRHVQENNFKRKTSDACFMNLRQWITISICSLLPQLRHFHLRQHVVLRGNDLYNRQHYSASYIEEIPGSFKHGSYRVYIVSQYLRSLWKNAT